MKSVYIFDLDNTLYLWNVNLEYRLEYEYKLIEFLKKLKTNNNILAIASFNKAPRIYLKEMLILDYFDYIISEYPYEDNYRKKSDMIIEILKNVNKEKKDAIFFDDINSNIKDCESNGIMSIKIDPKIGIQFNDFI